jgi:hypothetical protein
MAIESMCGGFLLSRLANPGVSRDFNLLGIYGNFSKQRPDYWLLIQGIFLPFAYVTW